MRAPEITMSAMERIIAAAGTAPSLHNSQPWRFRLRGDTIELLADTGRAVGVADPSGRETHIGCGAALANLRVAVAAHGREGVVRLLPRKHEPTLLAIVRIGGPRRISPSDKALCAAIGWRHTNRGPFQDREVPYGLRLELQDVAWAEGARLLLPRVDEAGRILDLVTEAEAELRADPAYRAEIIKWTTLEPDRKDGVPGFAFGSRAVGAALPLREFTPGRARDLRKAARFESPVQLAVLETATDTPLDWLRAGQALQRVLLVATLHDVAASFFTQPLEREELRRAVHDPLEGVGHPQMILRLGYPRHPVSATPRRDVADTLEVERVGG